MNVCQDDDEFAYSVVWRDRMAGREEREKKKKRKEGEEGVEDVLFYGRMDELYRGGGAT